MTKPIYTETTDKLQIRIGAHTEFANFKLEGWLLREGLGDAKGKRLLEIGCEDGNYFPIYAQALGKAGFLLAFDLRKDLALKARETACKADLPAHVFDWNYA
jgi:hypothetical protein